MSILRDAIKKSSDYQYVSNELNVIGGVILRGTRILIPNALREKVLSLAHEGHQGIVKTKQRLREKAWWLKIDKDAERVCKQCHSCQVVSSPSIPEPLKMTKLPSRPWEHLAIDLLGPLPNGDNLLVVVDYYSR